MTDTSPQLLHEFFDRRWPHWPDAVAVDVPDGRGRASRTRVTYAELAARSAAWTSRLESSVHAEGLVAILLPRTVVDAYAAPLGILRAGAAYTAIDAAFPDDRIRELLEDAGPCALVTDAAGAARVTNLGFDRGRIVTCADVSATEGRRSPHPPAWLTASTLAYVIYTSGTTGRPKGVMIEHRAIANLVASDVAEFGLAVGDRVGHGSSHAYDSSIEEVWLALAAGATLVVIDDETIRAGPDLATWLAREGVTVLCPPPTLLRAMGRREPGGLPALSLLYVGGEALTRDVADVWGPGRRLVNGYGPTECAVTAIRGPAGGTGPIDIGRPIAGVQAWVLDDALDEVPDGTPGELCIGGAGLSRGYWGSPELTARKFPMHPRLGRMYRTGDLAERRPDGRLVCLGRIDAQVKIRGHRVELEDIETHVARIPGIAAAACRVDLTAGNPRLVAFVVPSDPATVPSLDAIRSMLARTLPAYMVPGHVEWVASLPTTTGGKLDRAALPAVTGRDAPAGPAAPPTNDQERVVEAAMRHVAGRHTPLSIDDDFFDDLGGDSLRAAQLVTALREMPGTSSLTVRDVYEARTVRTLAARAADAPVDDAAPHVAHVAGSGPMTATVVQSLWLVAQILVTTAAAALLVLRAVPWALTSFGLMRCLLLSPLALGAGLAVYALASVAVAVVFKRVFVGRYDASVEEVWGGFYIRNWIVQRVVRLMPWPLFRGTPLQGMVLRALGARIGRGVHIHRGVDLLQGGWDLLEIGDDVTIGQDAALRLVDLDEGRIVIAPIRIGAGATLEARAGVGGGASVGEGAWLAALSVVAAGTHVPAGERWDGVPAMPAGRAPVKPRVTSGTELTPDAYALRLLAARALVGLTAIGPVVLVAGAVSWINRAQAADLLAWFSAPSWDSGALASIVALAVMPVPVIVGLQALLARRLSRSLGPGVIPRSSTAYLRVWLITGLVRTSGEWLSGTLMWPWWLRLAGMTIGSDGEISTIIDVVPSLVEIGDSCFLADGIYLAGPVVHQGTVTLARTTIARGTFIGNHAVIPAGSRLSPDLLIGVCTVADAARMRAGSSWFGHPPFELFRRPVPAADRRLTHEPPAIRRVNRWCWELLRFAIPAVPLTVAVAWISALSAPARPISAATFYTLTAPAASVAAAAGLCLAVLALKWLLLGRVSPGEHPLWSCWCSRWDFLYVAWARLAHPLLASLDGTLWLAWYLRLMGAHIGRRVVLGGGFAQVVDPDMLWIDDDVTVHALFQAHTFEDRVLKIGRVRIRGRANVADGAVLFYGAEVGEGASVAAHSVVMKHERLPAGRYYAGCPIRPVR